MIVWRLIHAFLALRSAFKQRPTGAECLLLPPFWFDAIRHNDCLAVDSRFLAPRSVFKAATNGSGMMISARQRKKGAAPRGRKKEAEPLGPLGRRLGLTDFWDRVESL